MRKRERFKRGDLVMSREHNELKGVIVDKDYWGWYRLTNGDLMAPWDVTLDPQAYWKEFYDSL